MTDPNHDPDADLAPFFAAARSARPDLPDDLFVRLMGDAEMAAAPVRDIAPRSLWSVLVDALGGWPSLAGLTTAALAGVWIGVAQPAGLGTLWPGDTGEGGLVYEIGDLMPGLSVLSGEG